MTRLRRTGSIACVASWMALGAACKADHPSRALVAIDLLGFEVASEAIGGDTSLLQAVAIEELRRIGFVRRLAEKDETGWQVTLQLASTDSAPITTMGLDLPFVVVAHARELGSVERRMTVRAGGNIERTVGGSRTDLRAEIFRAIRSVVAEVGAVLDLSAESDDGVVSRLSKKDSRQAAVVEVARRRTRPAVSALVAMLNDEGLDPDLEAQVIGALVAIQDPRSVGPLIERARHRPPAVVSQILFAVSAIGGNEAKAFLFTMETGHPDPVLRKSAGDALLELERREARVHGTNHPP